MIFLLGTHAIPCLFAFLVSPDIVSFDENGHDNVPCNKGKENLVTPPVVRFVIRSVDLLLANRQSQTTHMQHHLLE